MPVDVDVTRPWDTHTHTTQSTDWETLDFPAWVRQVTIESPPTNGTQISVSKTETGTYAASDSQIIVPAGGNLTLSFTGGRSQVREGPRLSVRTPSGSALVYILCEGGG